MNSSAFASLNTKEVPIPHLAGQTAVIRGMGWLRIREAWSSRNDPTWAEQGCKAEFDALVAAAQSGGPRDPLIGFWPPAVLKLGVESWSLGPVDDATIGQLATDVVTDLAREVMRFTIEGRR